MNSYRATERIDDELTILLRDLRAMRELHAAQNAEVERRTAHRRSVERPGADRRRRNWIAGLLREERAERRSS